MDRRPIKQFALTALSALLCVGASGSQGAQHGQWALSGSQPKIVSQLFTRSSNLGTTLDIVQFKPGASSPIQNYRAEQTRLIHLIIIRDDFREFKHVHPKLLGGHFTIPVALSSGHRYYAYADTLPAGFPQQVFRFQLGAGNQPALLHTPLSASNPSAQVGPYMVRLSTTRLTAHAPTTLFAYISKNGKPATDLRPYLGAAAHVVLINTSDLTYAHVHPMNASDAAMPPMNGPMNMRNESNAPKIVNAKMALELPGLSKHAAYKLWLQFLGGNTVYVAPFTIIAQ